jgi:cytochrome c oxidase subunit IV
MSAHADTPALSPSNGHAPEAGHHEPSKFHYFIALAMILAVITGIEVVLVYLPIAKWIIVSSLCILSAFKFLCVIFIFMHLRWDKVFCTIMFFIGLVLAGGTMWALLQLFASDAGKPLTSIVGLLTF